MRVFGDLNGPESHEPNDPPGSEITGKNGNLNEDNLSYAAGEASRLTDQRAVNPRDQMSSGAEKPEQDPRKAFAGGVLPDNPATHPHSDAQFGIHLSDRIGDQRLESRDHTKTPAQLSARRTNGGLWFVLMVLTLAMLGAGAYSYLSLRNNHVTLAQVPGLLQSVTTLGGRMDATEAKLRDLAGTGRV